MYVYMYVCLSNLKVSIRMYVRMYWGYVCTFVCSEHEWVHLLAPSVLEPSSQVLSKIDISLVLLFGHGSIWHHVVRRLHVHTRKHTHTYNVKFATYM